MVDESQRTRVECYSRIVGYLRSVDAWNEGKQEEFKMREVYDVSSLTPTTSAGPGCGCC